MTDRETVERVADRMVALGATHLHLRTVEAGLLLRALLRERDEAQTELALANIEMDTMRTMVRQYIRAGRYEDALGILDATVEDT